MTRPIGDVAFIPLDKLNIPERYIRFVNTLRFYPRTSEKLDALITPAYSKIKIRPPPPRI